MSSALLAEAVKPLRRRRSPWTKVDEDDVDAKLTERAKQRLQEEKIVLQDNLEREKSSGAKQPGLPEATSSMQLDADLQKKKKSICDNCTVA